ncbi:hypothetical protein E2320_022452, partial [Naja naja]
HFTHKGKESSTGEVLQVKEQAFAAHSHFSVAGFPPPPQFPLTAATFLTRGKEFSTGEVLQVKEQAFAAHSHFSVAGFPPPNSLSLQPLYSQGEGNPALGNVCNHFTHKGKGIQHWGSLASEETGICSSFTLLCGWISSPPIPSHQPLYSQGKESALGKFCKNPALGSLQVKEQAFAAHSHFSVAGFPPPHSLSHQPLYSQGKGRIQHWGSFASEGTGICSSFTLLWLVPPPFPLTAATLLSRGRESALGKFASEGTGICSSFTLLCVDFLPHSLSLQPLYSQGKIQHWGSFASEGTGICSSFTLLCGWFPPHSLSLQPLYSQGKESALGSFASEEQAFAAHSHFSVAGFLPNSSHCSHFTHKGKESSTGEVLQVKEQALQLIHTLGWTDFSCSTLLTEGIQHWGSFATTLLTGKGIQHWEVLQVKEQAFAAHSHFSVAGSPPISSHCSHFTHKGKRIQHWGSFASEGTGICSSFTLLCGWISSPPFPLTAATLLTRGKESSTGEVLQVKNRHLQLIHTSLWLDSSPIPSHCSHFTHKGKGIQHWGSFATTLLTRGRESSTGEVLQVKEQAFAAHSHFSVAGFPPHSLSHCPLYSQGKGIQHWGSFATLGSFASERNRHLQLIHILCVDFSPFPLTPATLLTRGKESSTGEVLQVKEQAFAAHSHLCGWISSPIPSHCSHFTQGKGIQHWGSFASEGTGICSSFTLLCGWIPPPIPSHCSHFTHKGRNPALGSFASEETGICSSFTLLCAWISSPPFPHTSHFTHKEFITGKFCNHFTHKGKGIQHWGMFASEGTGICSSFTLLCGWISSPPNSSPAAHFSHREGISTGEVLQVKEQAFAAHSHFSVPAFPPPPIPSHCSHFTHKGKGIQHWGSFATTLLTRENESSTGEVLQVKKQAFAAHSHFSVAGSSPIPLTSHFTHKGKGIQHWGSFASEGTGICSSFTLLCGWFLPPIPSHCSHFTHKGRRSTGEVLQVKEQAFAAHSHFSVAGFPPPNSLSAATFSLGKGIQHWGSFATTLLTGKESSTGEVCVKKQAFAAHSHTSLCLVPPHSSLQPLYSREGIQHWEGLQVKEQAFAAHSHFSVAGFPPPIPSNTSHFTHKGKGIQHWGSFASEETGICSSFTFSVAGFPPLPSHPSHFTHKGKGIQHWGSFASEETGICSSFTSLCGWISSPFPLTAATLLTRGKESSTGEGLQLIHTSLWLDSSPIPSHTSHFTLRERNQHWGSFASEEQAFAAHSHFSVAGFPPPPQFPLTAATLLTRERNQHWEVLQVKEQAFAAHSHFSVAGFPPPFPPLTATLLTRERNQHWGSFASEGTGICSSFTLCGWNRHLQLIHTSLWLVPPPIPSHCSHFTHRGRNQHWGSFASEETGICSSFTLLCGWIPPPNSLSLQPLSHKGKEFSTGEVLQVKEQAFAAHSHFSGKESSTGEVLQVKEQAFAAHSHFSVAGFPPTPTIPSHTSHFTHKGRNPALGSFASEETGICSSFTLLCGWISSPPFPLTAATLLWGKESSTGKFCNLQVKEQAFAAHSHFSVAGSSPIPSHCNHFTHKGKGIQHWGSFASEGTGICSSFTLLCGWISSPPFPLTPATLLTRGKESSTGEVLQVKKQAFAAHSHLCGWISSPPFPLTPATLLTREENPALGSFASEETGICSSFTLLCGWISSPNSLSLQPLYSQGKGIQHWEVLQVKEQAFAAHSHFSVAGFPPPIPSHYSHFTHKGKGIQHWGSFASEGTGICSSFTSLHFTHREGIQHWGRFASEETGICSSFTLLCGWISSPPHSLSLQPLYSQGKGIQHWGSFASEGRGICSSFTLLCGWISSPPFPLTPATLLTRGKEFITGEVLQVKEQAFAAHSHFCGWISSPPAIPSHCNHFTHKGKGIQHWGSFASEETGICSSFTLLCACISPPFPLTPATLLTRGKEFITGEVLQVKEQAFAAHSHFCGWISSPPPFPLTATTLLTRGRESSTGECLQVKEQAFAAHSHFSVPGFPPPQFPLTAPTFLTRGRESALGNEGTGICSSFTLPVPGSSPQFPLTAATFLTRGKESSTGEVLQVKEQDIAAHSHFSVAGFPPPQFPLTAATLLTRGKESSTGEVLQVKEQAFAAHSHFSVPAFPPPPNSLSLQPLYSQGESNPALGKFCNHFTHKGKGIQHWGSFASEGRGICSSFTLLCGWFPPQFPLTAATFLTGKGIQHWEVLQVKEQALQLIHTSLWLDFLPPPIPSHCSHFTHKGKGIQHWGSFASEGTGICSSFTLLCACIPQFPLTAATLLTRENESSTGEVLQVKEQAFAAHSHLCGWISSPPFPLTPATLLTRGKESSTGEGLQVKKQAFAAHSHFSPLYSRERNPALGSFASEETGICSSFTLLCGWISSPQFPLTAATLLTRGRESSTGEVLQVKEHAIAAHSHFSVAGFPPPPFPLTPATLLTRGKESSTGEVLQVKKQAFAAHSHFSVAGSSPISSVN